jgi:predicted dehydrogenase
MGGLHQTSCLILNKNGSLSDTVPEFKTRFDKAYLNEIEHFLEDVQDGRTPSVTLEDGIAAVELAFATNKALAAGVPIEI